MDVTKLSTKGQIVIPEEVRKDIDVGTAFIVTKKDDLIILKKIEGLTKDEEKELEELNKIWKEVDEGKGITLHKQAFLREMDAW